ncbi:MAG: glycosyltransferase [Bacteroidales bacterium]|nr:glycosyltransferase [Bacteroidales bacterium]
MNILLVSCWFPNSENPQQGSFILDHAKSLSFASINCKVLYIHIHKGNRFIQKQIKNYSIDNVEVIEFDIQSRFWKYLFQFPIFLKKTVLHLAENDAVKKADVIHSHAIFPAGIFGWHLSKKYKKPFVITEHWSRAVSFLKKHPLGFLGKRIYQNADALIFVSESLREKVSKRINSQNVFVIPNPIDGNLFHYEPKPEPVPVRCTLVATWKKRSPKRGDIVLEALRSLQKKISVPFQIDFVGEGDALEDYKKIVDEHNLPVNFCGYETKEVLAKRLQNSHLFLHPTESETFGIVIFEALKTGTPVLASDLDVFRPYINSQNGKLIKNDVESWQNAILEAFSKQYNYQKIAEEFKMPFSQSEVAFKTKDVYEKVIDKMKK